MAALSRECIVSFLRSCEGRVFTDSCRLMWKNQDCVEKREVRRLGCGNNARDLTTRYCTAEHNILKRPIKSGMKDGEAGLKVER